MQTNANGSSYSVATQTLHHSTSGYVVPIAPGESMYSLDRQEMANGVTVAYPDEFCSAQQGRDSRSFQKNATSYPQHTSFQETYHKFRDTDQERLILSSGDFTFDHLFSTSSSSNIANPSYRTEHYGYEGLPFVSENDEWPGLSRLLFNNELSLSLSAIVPPSVLHYGNSVPSDLTTSGVTSYSMQGGLLVSEHSSSFDSCGELQVPGSRFVHAVQEILTEITRYAIGDSERVGYTSVDLSDGGVQGFMSGNRILQEWEVVATKKHLLALLQVVDECYNQCMDEIHTVTSAFHAVTELDPNLHARFVLPTISFMYKNLRERISSHILALGSTHDHNNEGETRHDQSFEAHFIQRQWALQQLSKRDHQLWRPQRGLPEKSVSVLRTWLFKNFLHPYPKEAEKHLLALKSGLTRKQRFVIPIGSTVNMSVDHVLVSNWFINARVRLWKPMIEEMHAEMNLKRARRNEEESEGNCRNPVCFENRRFAME